MTVKINLPGNAKDSPGYFTEGSPRRIVEQYNMMSVQLELGHDPAAAKAEAYYVRTVTPAFITMNIANGEKNPGVEGRSWDPDMALYKLHEKFKVTANGCEWFAAKNAAADYYDLYVYDGKARGPRMIEQKIPATPGLKVRPA